ncbi:MAG: hypothetical protein LQ352_004801 [Teloschistes flavicans]|nr:MAG: hypothetical protein LQ352_004801 [Teloschistes flavicans]
MHPADRESFRQNFAFPPADDWGYPVTDPNLDIDDRGYPVYPQGYVPPHLSQTARPPTNATVQGGTARQISGRQQGGQTNVGSQTRPRRRSNDNPIQVFRVGMNRLQWPTPSQPLTAWDRVPAELVDEGGPGSSIAHQRSRLILSIARRSRGITIFAWSDPSENEMPTTFIEGVSWYQGDRGEWIAFDSQNGRVRLDIEARRLNDHLRRQALGATGRGPIPEPMVLGYPATNPPFQDFNRYRIIPRDRDPRIQWHRLGNYFRAWRPAEMIYDDHVQPDLDTTLVDTANAQIAARHARAAQTAAATEGTTRPQDNHSRDANQTLATTPTAAPAQGPTAQGTDRPAGTQTSPSHRTTTSMAPPPLPTRPARSQAPHNLPTNTPQQPQPQPRRNAVPFPARQTPIRTAATPHDPPPRRRARSLSPEITYPNEWLITPRQMEERRVRELERQRRRRQEQEEEEEEEARRPKEKEGASSVKKEGGKESGRRASEAQGQKRRRRSRSPE